MGDYKDKMEIDIKNLVVYIIKKWKLLLLAAVIGLTIFEICGGYMSKNAEAEAETDISVLAGKLSLKEKTEVDLAYRACIQCKEMFDLLDTEDIREYGEMRVELIKASQLIIKSNESFTSDQKAYLTALYDQNNMSIKEQLSDDNEDIVLTKNQIKGIGDIDYLIKHALLGILAGVFVMTVILALLYVFLPVLRTEEDLRVAFGLPIIGIVDNNSDLGMSLVYSNIVANTQRMGVKIIKLISSDCSENTIDKSKRMCEMFSGKEISVSMCNSILISPDSVNEVAKSDGVIICERIGKSLYENISREIELCRGYGVPIIGAVVIK